MEPSGSWAPPPAGVAVPWARIEASLRLPQRWPDPFRLAGRVAESPRRAAVAVLLRGTALGAEEVVLVQRGATAPHHPGELAFPGGMCEPWDRDLPATARRELMEELGVSEGLWEMGCFPDGVAKARTRFTPVFLRWEEPAPRFVLSSEIQDVLRLPLAPLLEAPWTLQRLELRGAVVHVPRLELEPVPLWGATALVLKSWLDVLSSVRNPPGADTLDGARAPLPTKADP
ncbi:NUDIX hydrolase [Mesoterricola sediminis]|uniref:Coenzyme A pyrophosphatase n=1 Tax=Mesoterricola sediminis TaxID=2927980 RepID=A0AA48GN87_9BACT|nr:CoA pyrophosphatase [Mesoterricola sediminis]BDU76211.1 coenzyme A pyrophosphatase [Mesoterricola sediminis]